MIDTDKYEGHLIDKAVEDNSQVWVWKNWMLKNAENIEQMNATAELLKDAPLLLTEVKRLRSIADDLYAYIVSDAGISLKIIEEQMDWRDEE
jgi:hypothetical protein